MGAYGWYKGGCTIPRETREQFNRQMLRLLDYGGMFRPEHVRMFGKEIVLLSPVELGPEASFCYNYFEDACWEDAGYDSETCRLWSNKIGSCEFADVIMAGYSLYEHYSDGCGLACDDGTYVNLAVYTGWINQILGTRFSVKNRFRLWDYAEKIVQWEAENDDEPYLSEQDFSSIVPRRLWRASGGTDLADLLYILNGTDSLDHAADVIKGTYPADVAACKKAVCTYLGKENGGSLEMLWDFLKKEYEEREGSTDGAFCEIAGLSLSMPARVFVYLAAEQTERDRTDGGKKRPAGSGFWAAWIRLKDQVYRDEKMKSYVPGELSAFRERERNRPVKKMSTCSFLRQDGYFTFMDTPEEIKHQPNYYISDADRLYWWDGSDEVGISDSTEGWLRDLAVRRKEIENDIADDEVDGTGFLKYFMETLDGLCSYYRRIYPFQPMFYEFVQNGNDKAYLAAVKLLKELADSDEYQKSGGIIRYAKGSWELTSRNVTHNPARMKIKRYLAVMANPKLRQIYFGF
jgi:hypothetical protein